MEANPVGLVGVVVDGIDMAAKRSKECELEGVRYRRENAESHTK